MIVQRTFDPALHNFIANQPGVYGMIAPDPLSGEPLDFSELAARPDDYVLLHYGDDAAMVFEWSAAGVYEMHTMFMPTCRGKKALEAGRAMVRYMFEDIDAFMLWGQTPTIYKAAIWFNRQLGGNLLERRTTTHLGLQSSSAAPKTSG